MNISWILASCACALVACSGPPFEVAGASAAQDESAATSSPAFRMNDIAVDPSTSRLYVTGDTWLAYSDDDGDSFREQPIENVYSASTIATAGRLYFFGIKAQRSTDDGRTFAPLSLSYSPYKAAAHGDTLLVSTENESGLLRSVDGGQTFEAVPTPSGDRVSRVNAICGGAGGFVVDVTSEAGARRSVYLSSDGGRSFRPLEGLDRLDRCVVSSTEAFLVGGSPTQSGKLYRLGLADPNSQPQLVPLGDYRVQDVALRDDGRFAAAYAVDTKAGATGALVTSDGFATRSFVRSPLPYARSYFTRAWVTRRGFGLAERGPGVNALLVAHDGDAALHFVAGDPNR